MWKCNSLSNHIILTPQSDYIHMAHKMRLNLVFEKQVFKLVIWIRFTPDQECRRTDYGNEYMGKIGTSFHRNTTMTCLPWADIPASVQSLEDDDFPGESLMEVQNFCRNPDFLQYAPWCYTTLEGDWAPCDIPFCGKSMMT